MILGKKLISFRNPVYVVYKDKEYCINLDWVSNWIINKGGSSFCVSGKGHVALSSSLLTANTSGNPPSKTGFSSLFRQLLARQKAVKDFQGASKVRRHHYVLSLFSRMALQIRVFLCAFTECIPRFKSTTHDCVQRQTSRIQLLYLAGKPYCTGSAASR
jgi:hypothetical protein